ncbi:transposase [Larkinella sp.]|uniref:transposase n=1 Tax=Larkinella sp. TaxID=2034517 RepID=UPI003BACA9A0
MQGGIALLFLKHYENLSDAKLVENLSVNSNYQLFCGLVLQNHEQIRDLSLVSRWRSKLAHYLDKDLFQSCLQREWKPSLSHPHVHKQDATCYEWSATAVLHYLSHQCQVALAGMHLGLSPT